MPPLLRLARAGLVFALLATAPALAAPERCSVLQREYAALGAGGSSGAERYRVSAERQRDALGEAEYQAEAAGCRAGNPIPGCRKLLKTIGRMHANLASLEAMAAGSYGADSVRRREVRAQLRAAGCWGGRAERAERRAERVERRAARRADDREMVAVAPPRPTAAPKPRRATEVRVPRKIAGPRSPVLLAALPAPRPEAPPARSAVPAPVTAAVPASKPAQEPAPTRTDVAAIAPAPAVETAPKSDDSIAALPNAKPVAPGSGAPGSEPRRPQTPAAANGDGAQPTPQTFSTQAGIAPTSPAAARPEPVTPGAAVQESQSWSATVPAAPAKPVAVEPADGPEAPAGPPLPAPVAVAPAEPAPGGVETGAAPAPAAGS